MRLRRAAGKLFVVSSPSGGGKTTVVGALLKQLPGLVRSVSVTTRRPRPAERTGADYQFLSRSAFERLRAQGALLEWAKVHQAYYGTPKAPIERALARGHDVVLNIDVQGAGQVRRRFGSRAILVFLAPPSRHELARRLLKRRTETPETIRRRLAVARRELTCAQWYDYVVVNRDLDKAVEQLKAIVTAERLRVTRGRNVGRIHGPNLDR